MSLAETFYKSANAVGHVADWVNKRVILAGVDAFTGRTMLKKYGGAGVKRGDVAFAALLGTMATAWPSLITTDITKNLHFLWLAPVGLLTPLAINFYIKGAEAQEEKKQKAIAAALCQRGLVAGTQVNEGRINRIVIDREDGGKIIWGECWIRQPNGNHDICWGAQIDDAKGKFIDSIETTCPGDSGDVATIVKAIAEPSIQNGAVLSRRTPAAAPSPS